MIPLASDVYGFEESDGPPLIPTSGRMVEISHRIGRITEVLSQFFVEATRRERCPPSGSTTEMIQRTTSTNRPALRRFAPVAKRGLILIVGPDGAGKSTFATHLESLARGDGVPVRHDHYRPGILFGVSGDALPVTRPRDQIPRGTAISAVKLLLVLVDSLIGSVGTWRRARRSGVVLLERGWYDMAVDPMRYRLPERLAGVVLLLGRLLPRADVAVILSGDPAQIHKRKPEIGRLEVQRQLESWRRIARSAAREVVELDSVRFPADAQANRFWGELSAYGSRSGWRRVPISSRRLDLRVWGQVPRAAWIHRSYRASARLVDPLRPILARVGAGATSVEETLEKAAELCRVLELDAHGLLAMRSSTEGRWVLGIAAEDRLIAVLKIGPSSDVRLRAEADVLDALTKVGRPSWAPGLLWSGQFEGTFAVLTRAVVREHSARPSLEEVAAFCSTLVRGDPTRPPLMHGDLAPWNVVRSSLGVCAFDWEHAKWKHQPLHDLAHYLIQSGALLRRYSPADVVTLLTTRESPGWKHLEACRLDPTEATDLLRGYLAEAPEFALGSDRFRAAVARCLDG